MTRRILIVDDDPSIREVAAMCLELVGGCEVLQASGGEEAITTAATSAPDAILLDVMMPVLDGPATLDRLKGDAATKHIPVVFLTAKLQHSERTQFAGLDVAGLIGKPFDPMHLHDEVATLLGWNE